MWKSHISVYYPHFHKILSGFPNPNKSFPTPPPPPPTPPPLAGGSSHGFRTSPHYRGHLGLLPHEWAM